MRTAALVASGENPVSVTCLYSAPVLSETCRQGGFLIDEIDVD
jgi:hypothetical protein